MFNIYSLLWRSPIIYRNEIEELSNLLVESKEQGKEIVMSDVETSYGKKTAMIDGKTTQTWERKWVCWNQNPTIMVKTSYGKETEMIYGEEQNTTWERKWVKLSYYKYEEPKRTKNRTRFTIEPKLDEEIDSMPSARGSIASANGVKKGVVSEVGGRRGKLVKRRGFGNRIMAPKGSDQKYLEEIYLEAQVLCQ